MKFPLSIISALTATCVLLGAHGLLDEQIAEVSAQLGSSPGNAELLLRRAKLHRAHQDYTAAMVDLRAIPPEDPSYRNALLNLSRLHREQDQCAEASRMLARYFSLEGDAPEAFRESALVHTALGRFAEAAAAWDGCLRRTPAPAAQDFLAAADAHLATGSHAAVLAVATQGLDQHPRSIPLHQLAGRTKITLGNLIGASPHFEQLRAFYPTLLPRLFFEEGAIWDQQGHHPRALTAYRQALLHLEELPMNKQSQPRLRKLRQTLATLVSP